MKEDQLNIILDQRSSVPLYEQICQQIRQKIESRQLEAGAPLPTNHEFCERLQVSYTTAHQAMATLAREGYVTRMARRGTVVKGVPRRGVVGIYSWVELLGGESEHDYYRMVMKYMNRRLEHAGRVHRMYLGSEKVQTPNLACDDLIRHVSGGSLCGVVLTLSFPRTEELMRAAEASHVPVVSLVGDQRVDYRVSVDLVQVVSQAANLLQRHQRNRVGVIYNSRSNSVRNREQLAEILGSAGIELRDSWIVAGEDTQEGGFEAAGRIALGQLDGLIVPDDVMAAGVDRWLAEHGVGMREDLMTCAMWNRGSRMRLSRPWELFEFNAEEQVRLAMDLLQDAIDGRRIAEPHVFMAPTHRRFAAAKVAIPV